VQSGVAWPVGLGRDGAPRRGMVATGTVGLARLAGSGLGSQVAQGMAVLGAARRGSAGLPGRDTGVAKVRYCR